MANTSNVLMAFAVVFLASLSLSSGFVKHNSDILNAFDHELQPLVREKREAEGFHLRNNGPMELEEELSMPKAVYEKRAVYAEEAKENSQIGQNNEGEKQGEPEILRNAEPEMSNAIEEEEQNAQDDVFSYKNMHDLIQLLILADEEDIVERLQQLRNATSERKSSNLPKRQAAASASASASAAAAPSSDLLGANLWDAVPLVDLDAHSCEVEAFSHGHLHVSGTIVHEFFCELRKFWHYTLIVLRNFKSALTLGPLVAGEVVSDNIFGHFFHHASHIFHAVIQEPHHLLILPDIIRDSVPFPSITGACHRIKSVFLKVLHFGLDLVRGHLRQVLTHLFSHPHLGHLREKLHHFKKFGSILPLAEIAAEPIVSTATATATATSETSIVVPDYHKSLAEVLSSCRGLLDGYYASGVPHLIKAGAKSFSSSSVFSTISSYLPRIPLFNNFGCGSVPQPATVTTSSASTATIGGSLIEPTIVSVPPVVPVGIEAASSSATASATVAEASPVLSAGPTIVPSIIPYESTSSNTVAAAAAATATAATSPIVSDYQITPLIEPVPTLIEPVPTLIEPVPTLSPTIVSNTVSESSSVAVAAPEVAVPATVLEDTVATAAATASAVASSATPIIGRVPLTLSPRRHRPRPPRPSHPHHPHHRKLLHPARYHGLDLDIDRRIRYPVIRSRDFSVPSSAAAAAAATSTSAFDGSLSSAAASSSASSVSSGGFNLVLPREQVVGALGYDYLLPGDIIAVTLRNKSILFGRVLDATSPITFSFLRPKLRSSMLHHGGRLWKLLPRDFRDPECIQKFNNPLLLRYGH